MGVKEVDNNREEDDTLTEIKERKTLRGNATKTYGSLTPGEHMRTYTRIACPIHSRFYPEPPNRGRGP